MKNPMMVITFIAVALVPILYSGFLIKGTWDPYGQLEKSCRSPLSIRIKAPISKENHEISGNEFMDELRKNNGFSWGFVSAPEAAQGMRNNRYYATITVPASFCRCSSITRALRSRLNSFSNPTAIYNFVAGQIGESATKELKNKLSKTLTEAYSTSILSQFETISSGLSEAGKGASELQAGAQSLSDGIHQG